MAANPSSTLPLSSQRDDNSQGSKKWSEVKGLELPLQENTTDDFDFTNTVLLSPPPLSNNFNPLEVTTCHSPPKLSLSPEQQSIQQSNYLAFRQNADTLSPPYARSRSSHAFLNGLHIHTDIVVPTSTQIKRSGSPDSLLRRNSSASSLPRRIPSVRNLLHTSAGSLSPGSVIASPQIAAMLDITPLPSPVGSGSDGFRMLAQSRSRGSSVGSNSASQAFSSSSRTAPSPPRRKAYHGLRPTPEDRPMSRDRTKHREATRSASEYVPDSIAAPKPRPIVVSGSAAPPESGHAQLKMHREEFLGTQRGIVSPITKPPSPPPTIHDDMSGDDIEEPAAKRARTELYTVKGISDGKPRRYKSIKELGQGTFSTVYLAVRQVESEDNNIDFRKQSVTMEGIRLRSQRLVAVKVVHHGPAGGADTERVEVSLQREVEIMKMTKHPSVVHLKAFSNTDGSRALLVMNYCPGGDLFEVASTNLEVFVPPLVRRIFAELVSAVRYLHQKYIVHRDIKLENILLNIPVAAHPNVPDWQTLDRAVVTLTDLGLSRRIPEPPESPLLTTRCGSEDYAAPELLMGQQYDARQTDAWALGVLLYSLMEGRLPFDPLPGARGDPAVLRARTPHRIARCEWAWYKYGNEDGDWDPVKGEEFEGALACVDGLLKRSSRRKGLAEIREMPWVQGGIDVDGGLRWVEEEEAL